MPDPTGPPPAGQTKHKIIGAIVRPENLDKTYNPWRDRPAPARQEIYNAWGYRPAAPARKSAKKHTFHGAIVRPRPVKKTYNPGGYRPARKSGKNIQSMARSSGPASKKTYNPWGYRPARKSGKNIQFTGNRVAPAGQKCAVER